MARGKGLSQIKIRKKPNRVGRAEAALINQKYMGRDEPVFTGSLSQVDFVNALNWYSYMCHVSEAREYAEEYLKNLGRMAEAKLLRHIPDSSFPTTIGWACRLMTRGFKLPMESQEYVETRLSETLVKACANAEAKISEEKSEAYKPTIQERIAEKQSDILGEVEGWIDDYLCSSAVDLYSWLKERDIAPRYTPAIAAKVAPYLEEAILAYEGKCPQLKEGYRHFTKAKLKELIRFFNGIIEDVEKYGTSEKKVRKVRTKKPPSVEKQLRSFKFQKEDGDLKVASVDPTKVLGSQELWCYNTKYKILSVLRAKDRGGIQVKGTTFVNIDEEKSKSFRTGRSGSKLVSQVMAAGKVALRNFGSGLKPAPLAARSNEFNLLLRVMQ